MLRLLRGVSPQRMLFHEYLPQKVNSPFVIPELQLSDSSKKIILHFPLCNTQNNWVVLDDLHLQVVQLQSETTRRLNLCAFVLLLY